MSSISNCLALHPHQSWLAIGTKEDLFVYDFLEDRLIARREQNDNCGYAVWSPSGDTLAHSGYAYELELWEAERAVNSGKVTGHTRAFGLGGGLSGPCFSPDGRWLANSDEQGLLTVRHATSSRSLADNLNGYPVAFSPDGTRLFCLQGAAGVNAFEMSPSECHFEFEVPFTANPSLPGIAISPDDRWLAATSYTTGVFMWDLEFGGPPVVASINQASSPCFNHAGTQLLTCFESGVQIWDWAGQEDGHHLTRHAVIECDTDLTFPITRTFSDPEQVVISTILEGSPNGLNWILQRDDFSQRSNLPSLTQQTTVLSPNGNWLAESSFYSPVYLRNLTTDKEIIVDPEGGLLAMSPDGRLLTAGRGGLLRAWETGNWTKAWEITTKTVSLAAGHCVFRPQGDLLAILGSVRDIFLVRPSDGKILVKLVAPNPGSIARLCFSDSGKMLAASTEDGRVQVWRLDKLERQLAQIGLDWNELLEMPKLAIEAKK